jgi:hypothetical protein
MLSAQSREFFEARIKLSDNKFHFSHLIRTHRTHMHENSHYSFYARARESSHTKVGAESSKAKWEWNTANIKYLFRWKKYGDNLWLSHISRKTIFFQHSHLAVVCYKSHNIHFFETWGKCYSLIFFGDFWVFKVKIFSFLLLFKNKSDLKLNLV